MKSPPKPSVFIDKSREYLAEFQLRLGVICFDLETAKSPDLVNNFVYLATQSYFDGTPLYRVIQGHVVQGGDPGGTGEGGVSYHLPDTIITVPHSLGTLSMANMGPNTNGSQFFITLRDMPWLDKIYSVIGQARRGIELLSDVRQGDELQCVRVYSGGSRVSWQDLEAGFRRRQEELELAARRHEGDLEREAQRLQDEQDKKDGK